MPRAIWPTNRSRGDEELKACAERGGLIARGYDDEAIRKIAGQNAVDLFRRVI